MRTGNNARRWRDKLVVADRLEIADKPVSKNASAEIGKLRQKIDLLDGAIAKLLAERFEVVKLVGDLKQKSNLPVLDNSREAEVLKKAADAGEDAQGKEAIGQVFQTIMDQSRKIQAPRQLSKRPRLIFPSVLVIGLGLIGGALVRQIKQQMPKTRILGCDRARQLRQALAAKLVDAGDSDFTNLVPEASLIILAASPAANMRLLDQIAPLLKQGQVVIDVTSTKKAICELAERRNLNGAEFVGGHPFLGNEKQGFAASAELAINGNVFTLTPTSRSSEVSIGRLTRWLCDLKFRVELIDAETHDVVAARISHLMQMVAIGLGATVKETLLPEELDIATRLAGKTFRENQRLMNSPPEMWFEIVMQNKEEVVDLLSVMSKNLMSIASAIDTGNEVNFKEQFLKAKSISQVQI